MPIAPKYRTKIIRTILFISVLFILWIIAAPGCMTFQITDSKAKEDFRKKGLILKTGNLQIGKRDIYYTSVGNDSLPTLFFIHGSPGTWSAFSEYMEDPEMLYHFRMIAFDRPGFGYSKKGGALNLADQSALLLPVIMHFKNGQPVYLAGHSLGAPLALKMAADKPGYFSAIGLISTPVDPALEDKESWRRFMNHAPLKYLLPGAFRPSNTELVYFKKDIIELSKELDKVNCKVMLIHGAEDQWVPVGNIDFAIKKLTHAAKIDTVIIQGANHFVPFTKKKEVKAALIKMIDSSSLKN